ALELTCSSRAAANARSGRPARQDELGGRGDQRRAPLGRTTPRRRLTPTSVWFRGCAMRPPTAPSLRPPARSCRSVLVTHPTGDVGLSSPWIEPIDHGGMHETLALVSDGGGDDRTLRERVLRVREQRHERHRRRRRHRKRWSATHLVDVLLIDGVLVHLLVNL